MKDYEGKTFESPPATFKASKALYFPNLHGRTLASSTASDTTPVLESKISIVSLFSSMWGARQVDTFLSEKQNAPLASALLKAGSSVQVVRLNVEEDSLKYFLLSMFLGNLKRQIPREEWATYFLIHKGLTQDIRQELGAVNGKVGYVYLLDEACRSRWAGCGPAKESEKIGLVKGLQRLLQDSETASTTMLPKIAPSSNMEAKA
jgi:ATPase complex subunit ATP10